MSRTINTEGNFWKKVNKTETCWLWTGSLKNGYPQFCDKGKIVYGHRWIYERLVRKIPLGQSFSHKCGNKTCVNPSHLIVLGSDWEDRFWEKVDKTSMCWMWMAFRDRDGYGKFGIKRAHRVAYELIKGEIPDGVMVIHSCDNPPCVNPQHLSLGTSQDNEDDKKQKGRQAKGEGHGMSKLTKEEVIEIRSLYSSGNYTQRQLASIFNVDQKMVLNIVHNYNWSHIK